MLKPLTHTDYRQLFCAALRSGKYIQTEGENWDGNLVCALGVGVREGLFEDQRYINESIDPRDFYSDSARKLGIDPELIYKKNDAGWTFSQLATWIEKGAPEMPYGEDDVRWLNIRKVDAWLASLPDPVMP